MVLDGVVLLKGLRVMAAPSAYYGVVLEYTGFSLSVEDEQADEGRDCRTCVSRDQVLRRKRGPEGKKTFIFPVVMFS